MKTFLALTSVLFSDFLRSLSLFHLVTLQELGDSKIPPTGQLSFRRSPSLTPDNYIKCTDNAVLWFTKTGPEGWAGFSLSSRSGRAYVVWMSRRKQLQGAVLFMGFLINVKEQYYIMLSKLTNQEQHTNNYFTI